MNLRKIKSADVPSNFTKSVDVRTDTISKTGSELKLKSPLSRVRPPDLLDFPELLAAPSPQRKLRGWTTLLLMSAIEHKNEIPYAPFRLKSATVPCAEK